MHATASPIAVSSDEAPRERCHVSSSAIRRERDGAAGACVHLSRHEQTAIPTARRRMDGSRLDRCVRRRQRCEPFHACIPTVDGRSRAVRGHAHARVTTCCRIRGSLSHHRIVIAPVALTHPNCFVGSVYVAAR
ncbi:hypothetical protein F1559_001875 [Cyanidiococcus yangmingshanensis]|uniref:Uncharacterized protein n=1 Tax=Cyanidiococcus yangmingshanensis TaxID=2690220 RepID=A0A7J7IIN8_9RHOD|nr:hypothetical protein F1559_001875 [Cyanidiococcus yangmingshanensis]